ncbi:MAG: hypothetical protein NTY53_27425 [Kiritimatiellaeota bacterium]|nr:hypothetical protein [Kiritimatiellota bacterium]
MTVAILATLWRTLELTALFAGTLLVATTAAHEGRGSLELPTLATLRRGTHVLTTLTTGTLLLATGTLLVTATTHHRRRQALIVTALALRTESVLNAIRPLMTACARRRALMVATLTALRRRTHVLATLRWRTLMLTALSARTLLIATTAVHSRRGPLMITTLTALRRRALELSALLATRRWRRTVALGAIGVIRAVMAAMHRLRWAILIVVPPVRASVLLLR